jgi:hypothetical protein
MRERTRQLDSDGLVVRQVSALRNRLAELEFNKQALMRDLEKERSMLAQLELDEKRLARSQAATRSLTGLEFTVCPRCMQSVKNREIEEDLCILCCQEQPRTSTQSSPELSQIRDQQKETWELLDEDRHNLEAVNNEIDSVRDQLSRHLLDLDLRSSHPTNPLVEEVADLSSDLARVEERIDQIAASQGRWASYKQLVEDGDEAERLSKEVKQKEADLRLQLEENSTRIVDLSTVFNEILSSLRDPWYIEAKIDPKTYLPVVDGEPFEMLSVGGARKTLVNLAYHLANLSMSISEREEVLMPTLLLVDSPRKNVGESALDSQVVEAVYRRLRTLQDASGGDFQLIIADNELPDTASRWIRNRIDLDYDNPLVPGVNHPGREVETVGATSTFELA